MRVLQVFNRYRRYGGEEAVVELEADMLRRNGHEVECLYASTASLDNANIVQLAAAGFKTVWSVRGYFDMLTAVRRFVPDIIHVHNTFPLLSPSVYWAANEAGIPLVVTLHNFRIVCANAALLRDGKACLSCVGGFGWLALRHRCFHNSLAHTSAVVAMNAFHHWLGTYKNKVQSYIVLSSFSRSILIKSGLPAQRVLVKPNFVPEQTSAKSDRPPRQMVYVGDISRTKGVHVLLKAWASAMSPAYTLTIVGDGPDRVELEQKYAKYTNVRWLGYQTRTKVLEIVAASRWLVLSSLCFENFPMVLLEAWSVGTPVIAPDHGAFPDIISDGEDGLLFAPGDSHSLAEVLTDAANRDEEVWKGMSGSAQKKCRSRYGEKDNYRQLVSIYRNAIEYRNEFNSRAADAFSASKEAISSTATQDFK